MDGIKINRPFGALWAIAMEPNVGHIRVPSNLIRSYFEQLIEIRLPQTIPQNKIPQLIESDEEAGWLGNQESFLISSYSEYPDDKTTACWFPNEKIAREWQKFVQGEPYQLDEDIANQMLASDPNCKI